MALMALEDDLSCPVCTEIFNDPVLLSCGHSFCRRCNKDHWTSSGSRNCPICRQVSPQKPVSNLGLRNTCETFLREKCTERKRDGGQECLKHGEKLQLFCQTDDLAICSECKKHEHVSHRIQPLQETVRQRKGKLKAALRPTERSLFTLQNDTAVDDKLSKFIQNQAQQTERRIKEEFKKLHQFLKKEEESRTAALNKEEKDKKGKIERRKKGRIRSLSERVREVEDALKDDDITFLQNYNSILNRNLYTLPDAQISSEALMDIPKHLGNLKYNVLEKMKDTCPYYPVILNPNTAPPNVRVSDDLSSVSLCSYRQDDPNLLPLHRNRMVLGSVGYGDGVYTWEIEVGKSRHWSLGVCFGLLEKPVPQPEIVFWGIRRDGDMYKFLNTPLGFKMTLNPEVVRVQLEDDYDWKGRFWRNVTFFNARTNSHFATITGVPSMWEHFPFVIPEDQSSTLHIIPGNNGPTVELVEQKPSFLERHRFSIIICVCFIVAIFIFLSWKIEILDK
ncbi:E3 ubiquitin-protein ligase TRIM35-like [Xyrauchen texanus]|uniref:E3 ubiquitin-protein ligase TRIM35-like n=1 Tax=Xyrauchen texanus TaxID=154827 RepID=UPI002242728B|nr:E3 ubiquitin-protein ligase TRIM35-like [Xyrauchen texanus]